MSAGNKLVSQVVDELRQMKQPWDKINEKKQQEIIDRVAAGCRDALDTAVREVTSQGFDALPMTVDQVVFKDGVKAVLKAGIKTQATHDLADMEGDSVTIVLSNYAEHTRGMDDVRADPDQPGLPLQDTSACSWNGVEEVFVVSEEKRKEWQDLFPGLDIAAELADAAEDYDGTSDVSDYLQRRLHDAHGAKGE